MKHKIKVTGIIYIDDDEYDPGPSGPLTNEAWESVMDALMGAGLDDVEFAEEA